MKLEEHPFIQNFPGDFAKSLVRHATSRSLKEGEILFDEGEPASSLFLVLSGDMVLEKKYKGEEFFTLARTRAGEYFGELAVLDGSARSARARCLREADLAEIRAKTLFSVLERAPSSSVIRFFLPLASNLRSTSSRFIREMLGKEKLAVVGEMADSIMHDLRSPLTTIQLACDLLRREVTDGPAERYCDMADNQIRVLQGMMEELLEFSRGAPNLKRKPVPVQDLFSAFRENNELTLRDSNIALRVEPIEGVLQIDSEKMLRVIQNLFNNAVDAMGDGGTVFLGARPAGSDQVELVFRDDGPGIPEAIRERIFEPFVTHGKEKGTGIGLAIVKTMVEAHGGTIAFSSEAGKGTEFRLLLPMSSRKTVSRETG